jgi:hypothetical protein
VRTRHARYFADVAEANFDRFRSPGEADAYRLVDQDIENLRAAFLWARETRDHDAAIRIAACTHELARFRFRSETYPWPASVVDEARRLRHRKLPLLLTMASDSAWATGDLETAKHFGFEAIALRDDAHFESFIWAFADLGQIAAFEGDLAGAIELARTGAEHPADAHDRFLAAFHLYLLAIADPAAARLIADGVVEQVEAAGMPFTIAVALDGLSAAIAETDPERSIALLRRAIALAADAGNRFIETFVTVALTGRLAASDPPSALATFDEIVATWQTTGDTFLLGSLGHLVVLFTRLGQFDVAATVHGAATRQVLLDSMIVELSSAIDQLATELGAEGFESSRRAGAAMSTHEAADYIREQIRTTLAGGV